MVSDKKLRRMEERIDEFRMRIKDSSQRAVFADVFDEATLLALYSLSRKGYINAMGGSVSTGEEANIFHAVSKKDDIQEIAVKIYMISTDHFNAEMYLKRDVNNIIRFFERFDITLEEEKIISIIKEEKK